MSERMTYSAAWADLVCSGIDADEAHDVLTAAAHDGCMRAGPLLVTCSPLGSYQVVLVREGVAGS